MHIQSALCGIKGCESKYWWARTRRRDQSLSIQARYATDRVWSSARTEGVLGEPAASCQCQVILR